MTSEGGRPPSDPRGVREDTRERALVTEDPAFSVVRGNPTEEEVAALVAVLALRSRAGDTGPATRPSGWSSYWRSVGAPVAPGPDAWRMSGRPQ